MQCQKVQKDKQYSTKHDTENLSNTNPTKNCVKLNAPEGLAATAPIVAPVMFLLFCRATAKMWSILSSSFIAFGAVVVVIICSWIYNYLCLSPLKL